MTENSFNNPHSSNIHNNYRMTQMEHIHFSFIQWTANIFEIFNKFQSFGNPTPYLSIAKRK